MIIITIKKMSAKQRVVVVIFNSSESIPQKIEQVDKLVQEGNSSLLVLRKGDKYQKGEKMSDVELFN
jgi:predicted DNA-binding ArsR family transcriptional regulator